MDSTLPGWSKPGTSSTASPSKPLGRASSSTPQPGMGSSDVVKKKFRIRRGGIRVGTEMIYMILNLATSGKYTIVIFVVLIRKVPR
jgi:hypothetical protein